MKDYAFHLDHLKLPYATTNFHSAPVPGRDLGPPEPGGQQGGRDLRHASAVTRAVVPDMKADSAMKHLV